MHTNYIICILISPWNFMFHRQLIKVYVSVSCNKIEYSVSTLMYKEEETGQWGVKKLRWEAAIRTHVERSSTEKPQMYHQPILFLRIQMTERAALSGSVLLSKWEKLEQNKCNDLPNFTILRIWGTLEATFWTIGVEGGRRGPTFTEPLGKIEPPLAYWRRSVVLWGCTFSRDEGMRPRQCLLGFLHEQTLKLNLTAVSVTASCPSRPLWRRAEDLESSWLLLQPRGTTFSWVTSGHWPKCLWASVSSVGQIGFLGVWNRRIHK